MQSVPEVAKAELVIKHIPASPMYQGKTFPAEVTSANFDLKEDETGSSVSRLSLTAALELLNNLKCTIGSKVAWAKVSDIADLGFIVTSVPEPHDIGHAEIRDGTLKLGSKSDQRKLKRLFKFCPLEVVEVDDSKVERWL